jgi:hypothetical protein
MKVQKHMEWIKSETNVILQNFENSLLVKELTYERLLNETIVGSDSGTLSIICINFSWDAQ